MEPREERYSDKSECVKESGVVYHQQTPPSDIPGRSLVEQFDSVFGPYADKFR